MSHKKSRPKYQRQQDKQKKSGASLISMDLVTSKHFKKIIDLLDGQKELTSRDRYLYGYALLRTENHLEALVTLWPLASKNHETIRKDCAILATHVFQEDYLPSLYEYSEDVLYTLFLAARNLLPESTVSQKLKQRLIPLLWQTAHYEKLERIVKQYQYNEEPTAIRIETLGKLAFFQAEKKLPGNRLGFIAQVLTGGACLIAHDARYHSEIGDKMVLLGDELKLLYSQLFLTSKPKLAWDPLLFNHFVDYEVNVLTQVLNRWVEKIAQKKLKFNVDTILSPSYVNYHDTACQSTNSPFLMWLTSESKELADLYQSKTTLLVTWALGGDKLSVVTELLQEILKEEKDLTSISPYLRLALMLRAESIKPSSFKALVKLSDFKKQLKTSDQDITSLSEQNILKQVAIQTVFSIINNTSCNMTLKPDFWQMLIDFFPVLQDLHLKNTLIAQSLDVLQVQHKNCNQLDLGETKKLAHQLHDLAFEKQIDALITRQQACLQFWMTINTDKLSKKSIRAIKNKLMLEAHLTLIADSLSLILPELSRKFFLHIKNLVENKRINELIPLIDLFECNFLCGCFSCTERLFQEDIPRLIDQLNLPVAILPKASDYLTLDTSSKSLISKGSVLLKPDPFKVLNCTCADSKQDIMQKVMKLIQQSPEKMSELRHAQSELFNPTQRFLHHYFRMISDNNVLSQPTVTEKGFLQLSLQNIPFRHEFSNAN